MRAGPRVDDPVMAHSISTPSATLRVLIADDDPIVRSALAMQLGAGFEIVGAARDAAEAIVLAERYQPDVAILDVDMPEGGGAAAARGIVSCSPDTAVVAYSADESHKGVLHMIGAGAITYLRKGIPKRDLIDTLHRSIDAKRRLG